MTYCKERIFVFQFMSELFYRMPKYYMWLSTFDLFIGCCGLQIERDTSQFYMNVCLEL